MNNTNTFTYILYNQHTGNIYLYEMFLNKHMQVFKNNKKEAINLKESKKRYMDGFGGRKGEIIILYYILKKLKNVEFLVRLNIYFRCIFYF